MFINLSNEYKVSSYSLVDNVFLREIMPSCTEKQLKIYLFGVFLSGSNAADNTVETFCRALSVTEKEVEDAFLFLEELGAVRIVSKDPLCVSYLPLSGGFARPRKIKPSKYTDFTKAVQALFPTRMISTTEYSEYFNIIETFHFEQNALLMIMNYCIKLKGENVSYRYICAVAKNWAARGITTVASCENELQSFTRQSGDITEILRSMGLRQTPDITTGELYTKWRNELGFSKSVILFVASSFKGKKATLESLDRKLLEYYRNKKFSQKEITEFDLEQSSFKELSVGVCRALGVYVPDLTPVTEKFTLPWLDLGFDGDTVLFMADYCFRAGKASLQQLDRFARRMHENGNLSKESVGAYIDNAVKRDGIIREILSRCHIDREVTNFDRKNLSVWLDVWGMESQLAIRIAESCLSLNPIAELHKKLSALRAYGITTAEDFNNLSHAEKEKALRSGKTRSDGGNNAVNSEARPAQNSKRVNPFNNYDMTDYSKSDLAAAFFNADSDEEM